MYEITSKFQPVMIVEKKL